jgi:hypothetical protein
MRLSTFSAAFVASLAALSMLDSAPISPARAFADDRAAPAQASGPVALDTSMHDFMEAMFQGAYRRLKTAMAKEPTSNQGWKAIRTETLTLAEGSNLTLLRKPEKDVEKWNEYCVASRDAGAAMFKAAKQKDFAATRKAYESMLTQCNACHKKFDKGKNQLEP